MDLPLTCIVGTDFNADRQSWTYRRTRVSVESEERTVGPRTILRRCRCPLCDGEFDLELSQRTFFVAAPTEGNVAQVRRAALLSRLPRLLWSLPTVALGAVLLVAQRSAQGNPWLLGLPLLAIGAIGAAGAIRELLRAPRCSTAIFEVRSPRDPGFAHPALFNGFCAARVLDDPAHTAGHGHPGFDAASFAILRKLYCADDAYDATSYATGFGSS